MDLVTDTSADTYGALLVDETLRLNEKSGLYANLGEHQIKEIIHAARWNLDSQSSLRIVNPDSVSEVGCIQACAGLALE